MPTVVPISPWLQAGIAILVAVPLGGTAGPASATGLFRSASGPLRAERADSPTVRLTAAEVKSRLAAATQSSPPDFAKANLSGLDLTGVDFKRANLTGVSLAGSKLAGANLFSCDLTDAILTGADFTKANLDGTVLRRAKLQHANLEGASLFATIIEAADLSEANLSGTRVIGYLRSAKLTGAIMRNANMGADPGNQSMGVMRATFVGADLTGADLSNTNLFKADLSHATLAKARLTGTTLSNAELVQTDLTHADLTGAKLDKANLDGADFTGAIGLDRVQGMTEARNRDKATFDAK